MTDIVERLRELEQVEHELAHDCDCPPEATANWKYAETCREAAAEIERLRAGGCARDQGTTQYCAEAAKLAAENERLRAALEVFACDCEGKAICLGNCMHRNARAALDYRKMEEGRT